MLWNNILIKIARNKLHFDFSDRCKIKETMIKFAFAIVYCRNLMQNGWIAEWSTRVKSGIYSKDGCGILLM